MQRVRGGNRIVETLRITIGKMSVGGWNVVGDRGGGTGAGVGGRGTVRGEEGRERSIKIVFHISDHF